MAYLEKIIKGVVNFSTSWLKKNVDQLKAQGVTLTYNKEDTKNKMNNKDNSEGTSTQPEVDAFEEDRDIIQNQRKERKLMKLLNLR